MSRKIIVLLVLLVLHAYGCFASRSLRIGRPKQSLPFQEPCMGANLGGITTVNPQIDECQVMQKTTLLGMDPELSKHKLSANKMQDTKNNKRSMMEIQQGYEENKSNGGDEVIHVEDYSGPSGDSPIHNHN